MPPTLILWVLIPSIILLNNPLLLQLIQLLQIQPLNRADVEHVRHVGYLLPGVTFLDVAGDVRAAGVAEDEGGYDAVFVGVGVGVYG